MQRREESEKRREEKRREEKRREERRSKKRKPQKKEDPGVQKDRRSRNTVFFQGFVAPEASRLAKAAGAGPSGQMRDVKMHAVVARSTFPSQKSKS